MRVLVKDQDPATENGIYYVSTAGAGGATLVSYKSYRCKPTGAELSGGTFTFRRTRNSCKLKMDMYSLIMVMQHSESTTSLTVSQFSGAGQIIAGTGLD